LGPELVGKPAIEAKPELWHHAGRVVTLAGESYEQALDATIEGCRRKGGGHA